MASQILKFVSWSAVPACSQGPKLLPALDREVQPPQGSCLLEEAKDERVEPHGVVGELCVLADLAVEAVQQLCGGPCGEKQIVEINCGEQSQNCTTGWSIKARQTLSGCPCRWCTASPPRQCELTPHQHLDYTWEMGCDPSQTTTPKLWESFTTRDLPPTLQRRSQPLAQNQHIKRILWCVLIIWGVCSHRDNCRAEYLP